MGAGRLKRCRQTWGIKSQIIDVGRVWTGFRVAGRYLGNMGGVDQSMVGLVDSLEDGGRGVRVAVVDFGGRSLFGSWLHFIGTGSK